MQVLKLTAIVIAVLLAIVGAAQADSANNHNHQPLSKRPDNQPHANSKAHANNAMWESATQHPTEAGQQDAAMTKSAQHYKQLKINRFAQRNSL